MHLFDQRAFGVILLVLLGGLVAVKKATTGSLLTDRPKGGLWLWLVHVFNMSFLLVASPLAAILLTIGRLDVIDATRVTVGAPWLVAVLEAAGLALCAAGHVLMAWALIRMGTGYQVGGSDPRPGDRLLAVGPYRLVRHPMYTAALCIALGLACLTQSLAYAAVFVVYVALIAALIPGEEEALRRTYGESYLRYQREVRRVVPLLF
jgi:protein-S-isoprenylcysteine O-methyltransferase Ste14